MIKHRMKVANHTEEEVKHSDLPFICAVYQSISPYSGPIPKVSTRPSTQNELDVPWLLTRSIENLAPQHIFTAQTANSNSRPSEYSFQFEFAAIIKHLLSTAYPDLLYRSLPEVKERDGSGNRRKRLDILVRDHNQLPSYSFELFVQGNKTTIDKHLENSDYYCRLHKCRAVYTINLTDNARTDYYGGTYQKVIPLHVIYDKDKGTALIKYKNRQEQVSFYGSPCNIMFKN